MYVHEWVYPHRHMNSCMYMNECTHIDIWIHVCTWKSVPTCTYEFMHMNECTHIDIWIHVCTWMSVPTYTYEFMYVHEWVYPHRHMKSCMYMIRQLNSALKAAQQYTAVYVVWCDNPYSRCTASVCTHTSCQKNGRKCVYSSVGRDIGMVVVWRDNPPLDS